MNRRDFLKALAALPAAAAVPAWVQPLPQWGVSIAALMRDNQMLVNQAYYAFLHPSVWLDLRRLQAMESWRTAYRHWRVARREVGITEPLEAVMARIKASVEAPEVESTRDAIRNAPNVGIGSYEGVRFIVSDKVA